MGNQLTPVNNQTKVGILVFATIVIFVFGFYFLKGINLFETRRVMYAVYDRVDGLYKTNQVEVKGIKVGSVKEMDYWPQQDKVVVTIALEKSIDIPANSTAVIVSKDLLGGKAISIILGDAKEILNEGDTIPADIQKALSEQLEGVVNPLQQGIKRIVPMLDSTLAGINTLLSKENPKSIYYAVVKLNDALDNIEKASAELNRVLQASGDDLNKTFDNLNTITTGISARNDEIGNIIGNISSFTDTLKRAQIGVAVENLNQAVGHLNGVLKEVREGNGTVSRLIKDPALYENIDKAVKNLDNLLVDVKERPGRYINISVFGKKEKKQ